MRIREVSGSARASPQRWVSAGRRRTRTGRAEPGPCPPRRRVRGCRRRRSPVRVPAAGGRGRASRLSRCSGLIGSWISMNSPLGRRQPSDPARAVSYRRLAGQGHRRYASLDPPRSGQESAGYGVDGWRPAGCARGFGGGGHRPPERAGRDRPERFPVEVLPSGPGMLEETGFSSPTGANKVARRIPGVGTCAGRRAPRQS